MKECVDCRQTLPLDSFGFTKRDGYRPRCRACHNARRRRLLENPWQLRRHKSQQLSWVYGITLDDFERILEEQGGLCAICREPPRGERLYVDHDHACCPGRRSCGRCVRGLLCHRCNSHLAFIEDRRLHEAALAYLKEEDGSRRAGPIARPGRSPARDQRTPAG